MSPTSLQEIFPVAPCNEEMPPTFLEDKVSIYPMSIVSRIILYNHVLYSQDMYASSRLLSRKVLGIFIPLFSRISSVLIPRQVNKEELRKLCTSLFPVFTL